MTQIVIIGTGGMAADLTLCFENTSYGLYKDISIKGYIDYEYNIDKYWKRYHLDKPVLDDIDHYKVSDEEFYVIGIADVDFRKIVINKIKEKGGRFINLIHPTAIVDKNLILGTGNIIGPYTLVDPNVKMGDFNVVLAQSIVSHDCVVGNNNIFSTTLLCGHVRVGDDNFFGIRATVIPHIHLGNRNKIQAGMLVDNNLSDDSVIFHRFKEKILVIPKEPAEK
jgi:sugar O-acyltransferase (sialic acid O-acetyltransferase NeuD family)